MIYSPKPLRQILILSEILLTIGLAFFQYSKPLSQLSIPLTQGTPDIGRIEADGYYFDMEDGEQVSSPDEEIQFHLALPVEKGSYTLTVQYASGAGSKCGVTSGNTNAIDCDDIALNHATTVQTANVIVHKDLSDMDFYVKYCGFQTFIIENVTLTGNHKDAAPKLTVWLFFLMLFNVCIYLWKKGVTPRNSEKLRVALFLIGFSILVSIPFYSSYLPLMDDFAFSYIKIEGIKDGLLNGQFPVRIHPGTQLGFGYALSCFYPELFLYFPAVLRIIGFSIMDSYKIFVFFMNLATASVAYYSFYQIFKTKKIGLLGSFLYTFSIYRLIDVYRRASIGEYLAMLFLPLIVAGFYRILTDDVHSKQYKYSFIPLMLGLTGLASSHILSCDMVGIFAVLACLLCIKRVFVKERFLSLLKAAGFTFLLTLYFWIPFFDMLRRDTYKVFANTPYSISANALNPYKYLTIFVEKAGTTMVSPIDAVGGDFSLGIALLIGTIIFMGSLLYILIKKQNISLLKESWLQSSFVCAVLGILAIFMTSTYFPWAQLESSNGLIKQILCMVQFPWRYLSIVTVLLTVVVCGLFALLPQLHMPKPVLYLLGAAVLCVTFIQTAHFYLSIPEQSTHQYFYDAAGLMINRGTGMGEYEPSAFVDVDVDKTIEELQQAMNPDYAAEQENGTGLIIESFEKDGTASTAVVANTSAEARTLYLPYIYYYGYRLENVFDNGDGLVPQLIESEKGTLAAVIPAGYYNGIHVTYKEPLLYRISEMASLLTLFGLLFYCRHRYKME